MKVPPTVRQLALLISESVGWRALLLNRFTVVLLLLVASFAGLSGYTETNDDGHFYGRVVDDTGEPVADARVVVRRVQLKTSEVQYSTTTDKDGYYEFENKTRILEYRITASKEGVGLVREHVHLYFRGQNNRVDLVINRTN